MLDLVGTPEDRLTLSMAQLIFAPVGSHVNYPVLLLSFQIENFNRRLCVFSVDVFS